MLQQPQAAEARPKLLVIDDTPTIRALVKALLGSGFEYAEAKCGEEGLELAPSFGPDLIITDLMMPGIDGFEVCRRVKGHPALKDIPVIMLTSKDDDASRATGLEIGADDYLFKPIRDRELRARVRALVRLRKSIQEQRILLEKTLHGSVKMLCDLLAMTNPEAFGHANRARDMAKTVADALGVGDTWAIEVAAMLSQVPQLTLPPEVAQKALTGEKLTPVEEQMIANLPSIADGLLANIPRLDAVREVIGSLDRWYGKDGEKIPAGARIVRAVLDFINLENRSGTAARALAVMAENLGRYDTKVLQVLTKLHVGAPQAGAVLELRLTDLKPNMVLDEDVFAKNGVLIITRGQEVTTALISRLENFAKTKGGLKEPIRAHFRT